MGKGGFILAHSVRRPPVSQQGQYPSERWLVTFHLPRGAARDECLFPCLFTEELLPTFRVGLFLAQLKLSEISSQVHSKVCLINFPCVSNPVRQVMGSYHRVSLGLTESTAPFLHEQSPVWGNLLPYTFLLSF